MRELERIAYHEAGHAIVAFVLHRRFTHVSIIPKDDTLGHVNISKHAPSFQPESDYTGATRNLCEKEAMVCLGGVIAERVEIGRANLKGSHQDIVEAFDWCIYHCGTQEEANAYVDWLWERTKSIVTFDAQRVAIKALAKELMVRKYIGERTARKIIRLAFDDYVKKAQQKDGD
jgi:hypothetical protein